jgi:phytoene synthase
MTLDPGIVNRAAPPGSSRYFAQLYAPPEKREALLALFAVESEIRDSAENANHDVAHTRLRWWRDEIERLANGNAQHPAARSLQAHAADRGVFRRLHELVVSADMDLARMTYANARELHAYTERSGGVTTQLAGVLLTAAPLAPDLMAALGRLGGATREVEILRDLRRDVRAGRLYVPLDQMDACHVKSQDLDTATPPDAVLGLVADFSGQAKARLREAMAAIPKDVRSAFRPVLVLAALHERLLHRISQLQYDVFNQRIDLRPLERVWSAWRAARRAA